MNREEKYLLGCLYAIHRLQEQSSTQYTIRVDGKWETIPWDEICEWIEKQYAIEQEDA